MTVPAPDHLAAARALLDTIRLRPAELDRHLERAASPEYWRALVPGLSIGGPGLVSDDVAEIEPPIRSDLASRFRESGVIETAPVVGAALTARLRAGVLALMRADWPPVFAWAFDELWQLPRTRALTTLLEDLLGPGLRQSRHFWVHVVPGRRGSSGWRPHQDYTGQDLRLTVWMALSDATVDTGCMTVIPRHLVPGELKNRWSDVTSIAKPDVMKLLHASQPLPCRAGAVLAWDAGLMHWGAPRQSSGEPRVSVSLEFAPASTDASLIGPTWPMDAASVPPFEARLGLIARALRLYQHGDARAVRYAELADRLAERFPA